MPWRLGQGSWGPLHRLPFQQESVNRRCLLKAGHFSLGFAMLISAFCVLCRSKGTEMAPGFLSLTPEHFLPWVTKNTFSSQRGKGNTPWGVRQPLSRGWEEDPRQGGTCHQLPPRVLHTTRDSQHPSETSFQEDRALLTTACHHALSLRCKADKSSRSFLSTERSFLCSRELRNAR